MLAVRHAVGVDKMRAAAAEPGRAGVHALDKCAYRARDVLGDDVARLVCRGESRAVEKILHAHRLAAVDVCGRAVVAESGLAFGRCRDHIVERHRARLDGLDGQQQSHDLREARGRAARVGIDVVKYPAACQVSDKGALSRAELRRTLILCKGAGTDGAQRDAQAQRKCRYAQFLHFSLSLYTFNICFTL